MIRRERCIVMDVDGTLCTKKQPSETYDEVVPIEEVAITLREYHRIGFYVILTTSRNMNSYDGNVGLITARTAKQLLAWLDRHNIPYHELHVGKPWVGRGGFYIDDKAIRPNEFVQLSYEEILAIVGDG